MTLALIVPAYVIHFGYRVRLSYFPWYSIMVSTVSIEVWQERRREKHIAKIIPIIVTGCDSTVLGIVVKQVFSYRKDVEFTALYNFVLGINTCRVARKVGLAGLSQNTVLVSIG